MANLSRIYQKIFGSTAPSTEIGKFGSLAAGTPQTTNDPALMQSLGNWLNGWNSAVVGYNSPCMEDMNAVHYVLSYQLAYLLQKGIAEYNASTTYYQGSVVYYSGKWYVCASVSGITGITPSNDGVNWVYFLNAALTYGVNLPYIDPTNIYTNIQSQLLAIDTKLSVQPNVWINTFSGSSYTIPSGVKYLKVTLIGGGGGGGATSDSGTAGSTSGGAGGDTYIETSSGSGVFVAKAFGGAGGGVGGIYNGAGGSTLFGSYGTIYATCIAQGELGSGGNVNGYFGTAGFNFPKMGGIGGGTPYSGRGVPLFISAGTSANSLSGCGGGGGSSQVPAGSTTYCNGGSGGAAGGFIQFIWIPPSGATSVYCVTGIGGNAGVKAVGSAKGNNGGFGGSGLVLIEEHYV